MQMPLDLQALLKAAADTDAARNMPISVSVFFDPEAPIEFQQCILNSLEPVSQSATVHMLDYPDSIFALEPGTDLAILAAGPSTQTGALAERIRKAGVPVLTCTLMPDTVKALAAQSGYPLYVEDVVAPSLAQGEWKGAALQNSSQEYQEAEPYALTPEREASLLLRMGEWVVATFREKRLAFALAFPFVRKPLAMDCVNATALQNAGIGLVMIIPGADLPVMTLNQAKMVLQIAAAYDQELGKQRAVELLGVVGGGFACRAIARELVELVPGLGWAVKAGVGFGGTVAMGYSAIAYFDFLESEGASAVDAFTAVQNEASRMQRAAMGQDRPADQVLAAVQVLVRDAGVAANKVVNHFLPVAGSIVSNICAGVKPDIVGLASAAESLVSEGIKALAPASQDSKQ